MNQRTNTDQDMKKNNLNKQIEKLLGIKKAKEKIWLINLILVQLLIFKDD